jgi:hypothetical protein
LDVKTYKQNVYSDKINKATYKGWFYLFHTTGADCWKHRNGISSLIKAEAGSKLTYTSALPMR